MTSSFQGDSFEEVDAPAAAPVTYSPFAGWVNDSKDGRTVSVGQRLPPPRPPSIASTSNGVARSPVYASSYSPRIDGISAHAGPSSMPAAKRYKYDAPTPSASTSHGSLPSPHLPFASPFMSGLPSPILPTSHSPVPFASGHRPSPLPSPQPLQNPVHQMPYGMPRASSSQISPVLTVAEGGRIPIISGSAARAGQVQPRVHSQHPYGPPREQGPGVIDLTASDEEDGLEITGHTGPKRPAQPDDEVIYDDSPVCIGQLSSLALIMYAIPEITGRPANSQIAPHTRAPGLSGPLPVKVTRATALGNNETLRLATYTASENFAVVEHRIGNVIGPFLGAVQTGHGAVLALEATVHRKGEANPMMLPLSLLLFCRPQYVKTIAHALESNAVFLEHPMTYDPALHRGARYSNPHNPSRIGEADRRRRELLGGLGPGSYGHSRTTNRTVEAQQEQVQAVFKSLRSGVDMEETEPPARIVQTQLYRHQKQALSFLLDRERLRTVEDIAKKPTTNGAKEGEEDDTELISLWRQRIDGYGKTAGWLNVVTGVESSSKVPPPQCRGAILADDMGLGKTIVLISLIAHTIEDARAFAQGRLVKTRDTTSHFDAISAHPHASTVKPAAAGFAAQPHGMAAANPSSSSGKKKKESKTQLKREEAELRQRQGLIARSRATLIICPLSTIQNWESQIEEHAGKRTLPDGESSAGLSVYIYHGPGRTNDPLDLLDYDVVLTTFSTVGSEFSRLAKAETAAAEEAMAAAAEMESSDGLEEVDSTGEPVKPKLNGPAAALKAQLKSANGTSGTEPNTPTVSDEDGKSAKCRKRKRGRDNPAPLQMIEWFRIVLDEAHMIKEHSTIQAKAACDLAAERRTCLTGTPLQNQLDDLFSLMRFLRLEPFTDRAIWNAYIGSPAKLGDKLGVSRLQLVMRHLALRRTKFSKDADGKPILDLPKRKDELVYLDLSEKEKAFYSSHHQRYRANFMELEQTDTLLKNYCSILQELLRLRQICVHADLVRESEDANRASDSDILKAIERDGISIPRALQLFALMRDTGAAQCAECGVDLAPMDTGDVREEIEDDDMSAKPGKKRGAAKGKGKAVKEEDGASGTSGPRRILTRCTHLFCLECFRSNVCPEYPDRVAASTRAMCSICRGEISPVLDAVEVRMADLERMALVDADDNGLEGGKKGKSKASVVPGEMSTKIHALLEDILPFSQANPAASNYCPTDDAFSAVKEEDDAYRPHRGEIVKSVVFSQWVKLLDKISEALDQCGIRYARLDGSMSRPERSKAMDNFKSDPGCEILLVSLRAGGVGLNLTAAQRVYLMEPFWNPAVEAQALDRVHRLGQTKPVKTMRLVIRDSIEANMLIVQKRKQDLANLSMSATLSKQELAKQRVEDIRTLLA